MEIKRKDLLGLKNISAEKIELILDTAKSMKGILGRKIKKVPVLRGKTVVNIFYEASTRTRTSFELAGKYLSADTVNISSAASSVAKGESLRDTAKTVAAMKADVVILRHPMSGAADFLARAVDVPVINAGDGTHEHPTQALLDMFTVKEKKGKLQGLRIAIIGDILHSRVARSNIWGFNKFGAQVRVAGPPTLIPPSVEEMGAKSFYRLEDALDGADVVYMLRIQMERQEQGLFPSLREYSRLFGLTREKLQFAKPDALVMHPGPMNRGIEIPLEVAYSSQSVIEEQVTNGVAVRMALLYLLVGGGKLERETAY